MTGRTITTSGEYSGGPLDGARPSVELDTDGKPPTTLTPAPELLLVGLSGHYAASGKTDAGRFRYRWVPASRGLPRPQARCACAEPVGRGCPRWQPS